MKSKGNMDALARLMNDMKDAMRAKDRVKLDTVRYLMAQVKNAQIDKPNREAITDLEFTAIVKKVIKSTEEAIEQYRAGDREDLVAEEQPKLVILKEYLPEQMSEEKIRELVQETMAANPGMAVGPLTGIVMKQTAGTADGTVVSRIVREMLA